MGRPRGERRADSHAFVRLTAEERALIERACAAVVKDRPGATATPASFMRATALAEARRVLR